MSAENRSTRDERMRAALAEALGPYGFQKAAREALRATPEYARARELGVARRWLDEEGESLAHLLYEAAAARIADLEQPESFR
jgi:hypothetical protein